MFGRLFNTVKSVPKEGAEEGLYFKKDDISTGLYVRSRFSKIVHKIFDTIDYKTKIEVDKDLLKKANQNEVDAHARSIDVLATTKAEKSVVEALTNGIIKKDSVDTYNDTSGGKTSLLSKYPAPKVGWDVLVREENVRYNWNGEKWVSMETGVYDELVITEAKLSNIVGSVDKTAPTPRAVRERLGLTLPYTSTPNGGVNRFRDVVLKLHKGAKTFLVNFVPDENFFSRSSTHTRLLLVNFGANSVSVFIDGVTGQFYLRVGSERTNIDFYHTSDNRYNIALQATLTEISLYVNEKLYATVQHSYTWLVDNEGSDFRVVINRDTSYNDDLGYFMYGNISSLKILYELVTSDYSSSESKGKLDERSYIKDASMTKYIQGVTFPFLSDPNGDANRYKDFSLNLFKGDKTFLVNFIPDDNYWTKPNKYACPIAFHNGNSFIKVVVEGATNGGLLHFIIGSDKIFSTININDLSRLNLALQVTSSSVILMINGEKAIELDVTAKPSLSSVLNWLHGKDNAVRVLINKDASMPDNLGYFIYGDVSTLKIYNKLVSTDYSMLETRSSSEPPISTKSTYSRFRPSFTHFTSKTTSLKSTGIMDVITSGNIAQFEGVHQTFLEGNKEVFASLYTGSNPNIVTPSILEAGMSTPVSLSGFGRKVDNEWVHPDICYSQDGIAGYHYFMINSCYPEGNNNYEDEDFFVSVDGVNWKRVLPFGTSGESINLPPQDLVPTSDIRSKCFLPIPKTGTVNINGAQKSFTSSLKHDPAIYFEGGYVYVYLFYNFRTDPSYSGNSDRFVNVIRTNNLKDWEVVREDGSAFALTAQSSKTLWTKSSGVNNYIRHIDRAKNPQGNPTEDRAYSIVKVANGEYYAYLDNQDWGATSSVYRYRGTSLHTFDWSNRETIVYPSKLTSWHVSVRYYNNTFYLVANGIVYTSSDGVTFTESTSITWKGGFSDRKYKASFCIDNAGKVTYVCGLLGQIINTFPADSANGKTLTDQWRSRTIIQKFDSLSQMTSEMKRGYADFYIDIHNLSTGESVLKEAYGVVAPGGGYKIAKIADVPNLKPGEYAIYMWGQIACNSGDQFGIGTILIK